MSVPSSSEADSLLRLSTFSLIFTSLVTHFIHDLQRRYTQIGEEVWKIVPEDFEKISGQFESQKSGVCGPRMIENV